MVRRGVIPPAKSGEIVAAKSQHVKIHDEGLLKLANEIVSSMKLGKIAIPDSGGDGIHADRDHPKAVDWIFVTDALNFCFWTMGDALKWRVDGQTGYNAFEAALTRAIREGHDITNPNYYTKITLDDFDHLMRSDDGITKIPLLPERIRVLKEVGTVLLQKYEGTFENCIKRAKGSAIELLKIIVGDFECFRDEANFDGQRISFYKRAQILVADLWNCFEGKSWGEFHDIDQLTMFADYRVPQVLVHFGALSYSDKLFEKLKRDEILVSGSVEEVEIRGCSIHAVELLRDHLRELLKSSDQQKGGCILRTMIPWGGGIWIYCEPKSSCPIQHSIQINVNECYSLINTLGHEMPI